MLIRPFCLREATILRCIKMRLGPLSSHDSRLPAILAERIIRDLGIKSHTNLGESFYSSDTKSKKRS